jgi:hypothetical protein
MRFIEIRGNLMVPISNEEMILLEKIKGSAEPLSPRDLEERESVIANRLVHRGVLSRVKIDGKSCLVYNDLEDLWGI